jgi:hypothetical protein
MVLGIESDVGQALGILTAVIMISCVVAGVLGLGVWAVRRRKSPREE